MPVPVITAAAAAAVWKKVIAKGLQNILNPSDKWENKTPDERAYILAKWSVHKSQLFAVMALAKLRAAVSNPSIIANEWGISPELFAAIRYEINAAPLPSWATTPEKNAKTLISQIKYGYMENPKATSDTGSNSATTYVHGTTENAPPKSNTWVYIAIATAVLFLFMAGKK